MQTFSSIYVCIACYFLQVYISIIKHKKHCGNLKINLKIKQKIYFLVN